MPKTVNIGFYHKDDPSRLLYIYESISTFSRKHHDIIKHQCLAILKRNQFYNIPHSDDKDSYTYVIRPIDRETYHGFGRYPALEEQIHHALRTGLPFPQLDPTQQQCTDCNQIKPLNLVLWHMHQGVWEAHCRDCRNIRIGVKNKSKKKAIKEQRGPFFCQCCYEWHEPQLRHGTEKETCNMKQRASEAAAEGTLKDPLRRPRFGLFLHTDPDTIYYVYPSRRTFLDDYPNDNQIDVHRWDHMMVIRGYYNIPHYDGQGSTYRIKPISDEEFSQWGEDEEYHAIVKEAVRTGESISIRKAGTRVCDECGVRKPLDSDHFAIEGRDYRSKCKVCRSQMSKEQCQERYKEAQSIGTFMCNTCQVEHPWEERVTYTNLCKAVENERKRLSMAERKISQQEAIHSGIIGKDCEYGCPFDPAKFTWVETRWRGRCNRCDVNGRMRGIKHYAGKRDIRFEQCEEEEMKKMLELECTYCDAISDSRLNGLDRLNSTDKSIGYCLSNVVTSCPMCNISKHEVLPSVFVERMCKIAGKVDLTEFYSEDELCLLPEWKLVDNERIESEGYNDRKNGRKKFPRKHGICYLCGYEGIVGTDRVDSLLSYEVEENTRPCCTLCNRFKRDIDLRTFYDMAVRITEKHNGVWEIPVPGVDYEWKMPHNGLYSVAQSDAVSAIDATVVECNSSNTLSKKRKRKAEKVRVKEIVTGLVVGVYESANVLAEELGVTKRAITKKLDNGNLKGKWVIEVTDCTESTFSVDSFIQDYKETNQRRGNQYTK